MRFKTLCFGLALGGAILVTLPGCQATSEAPTVGESDFDKVVLKSKLPVLVDFSAPARCEPCRQMEPVVGSLANELKGKAVVVRIECDENQRLVRQYRIDAIPCFIVFKDGREVGRRFGVASKEQLKEMLDQSQ
jgi:thioredoxin 1